MQPYKFEDYHLSNDLLKAIELLNYETPTPVQRQVIPEVLAGRDIIVKSQTGSGKTASFAIPVCNLVNWDENKPQALVITPTRELAIQVKEDFFNIGRFKRIKVLALYGKSPFGFQEKELKQKTHVVVGTPGRIIDHLERGTFDTSNIQYLIVDEADELLNMGFIEQLEAIIKSLPQKRTTMLFSATMPGDIQLLCEKYMREPVEIEITEEDPVSLRIGQQRCNVKEADKIELLRELSIVENPDSCLIFCNTKQKVDQVHEQLHQWKYSCEKIHGDMEQPDRLKVMNSFKQGYFRYLVATDIAARGIDVDNISLVINYDVPQDRENYVHRIGRTGRASRTGKAITFVTEKDERYLEAIYTFTGKEIELRERPDSSVVEDALQQFGEKMGKTPKIKETKGAKLSKDIMRLHINAGKKTKLRPTDIVGTLCSIEGITAEDIGIINILDVSTFVEILNNKGEAVFSALQHKPIKGRLRRVSRADSVDGGGYKAHRGPG